jgi:hypothetical protein
LQIPNRDRPLLGDGLSPHVVADADCSPTVSSVFLDSGYPMYLLRMSLMYLYQPDEWRTFV